MRRHLYRTPTRHQRSRKTRRLLAVACLVVMALIVWGYAIAPFGGDDTTATVETAPPTLTFDKTALEWPSSGYAAVGTVEDGVLAQSSENEKLHPTASIAKVITALAVMKKQPFEPGQSGKSYTLTAEDVTNYNKETARGGSSTPVYKGMAITQYEALQAMLIASSNNMAGTLARKVFGSESAYTSYANDMLKDMGLRQTTVTDPSGFNPSTVSTPSELIIIGVAALKYPIIAEIVAQPQALLPHVGIIKNTNELLATQGVVGIKTGTTDEAGSCLLFAERFVDSQGKQKTIVGVIMNDSNPINLFIDSKNLLTSTKHALGTPETESIENPSTVPERNNRALRP